MKIHSTWSVQWPRNHRGCGRTKEGQPTQLGGDLGRISEVMNTTTGGSGAEISPRKSIHPGSGVRREFTREAGKFRHGFGFIYSCN